MAKLTATCCTWITILKNTVGSQTSIRNTLRLTNSSYNLFHRAYNHSRPPRVLITGKLRLQSCYKTYFNMN